MQGCPADQLQAGGANHAVLIATKRRGFQEVALKVIEKNLAFRHIFIIKNDPVDNAIEQVTLPAITSIGRDDNAMALGDRATNGIFEIFGCLAVCKGEDASDNFIYR